MIPYLDKRSKKLLELIDARKKDKILVIGTGVFPKIEYFLKDKVKNITSVDIDKKNLENAKKILLKVDFRFLNAEKKFNLNQEFDKVIFTEVLEHLRNEENALSEINRILRKNGVLIISVPKKRWFNIFSPISWFQHKREYNEKQIIKLLKANKFKTEKIIIGGNIYDLFNLWLHLIYKYFFRKLRDDFFREKINQSWKRQGKGTDILIKAEKEPFLERKLRERR